VQLDHSGKRPERQGQQGKGQQRSIAAALAIASCSLLGEEARASSPPQEPWQVDAALLYYGEQDRVSALEAGAELTKAYGDKSRLDIKLVFDSLSGASASGAIAQDHSQTLTRPSGKGEYVIAAGEQPLDDTFHDTRAQGSAAWTHILSPLWQASLGVYGSKEYDYVSLGTSAGIERSLNKDNTNLGLSAGYSYDLVDPVGGRPVAFSPMTLRRDYVDENTFWEAFAQTRRSGSREKKTLDLMLSLTQILSRRWLFQANYSFSHVEGYLTDAYKVLSELDAAGTSLNYRYEHRPDLRLKHGLYLMSKGLVGKGKDPGVLELGYRFSRDDWQLESHTFESRYRYNLGDDRYWQLHLRYYHQLGAEFYRPYLLQSRALPDFASADYRIGFLNTYTLGLKFGQHLANGHELAYRLEYYLQRPQSASDATANVPVQITPFEVRALIAQISYSFPW
jgi:hypothetical protein